jgi:hypothetical protein
MPAAEPFATAVTDWASETEDPVFY